MLDLRLFIFGTINTGIVSFRNELNRYANWWFLDFLSGRLNH